MVRLLYICNNNNFSIQLIGDILKNIEEKVDEIVLHYSYQIPPNTANIIETHDKIKLAGNEKLLNFSKKIKEKYGINTIFSLTLGTEKNTIKRMLKSDDFKYVSLSTNNDKFLISEFENIKFILPENLKSA